MKRPSEEILTQGVDKTRFAIETGPSEGGKLLGEGGDAMRRSNCGGKWR